MNMQPMQPQTGMNQFQQPPSFDFDSSNNMPSMPPMPPMQPAPTVPQQPSRTPETVENTYFTAGFLRTQIGRLVRVEFLIGTNSTNDRVGRLIGVGASYILLESYDRTSTVMCDIYSIKFVTILNEAAVRGNEISALFEN